MEDRYGQLRTMEEKYGHDPYRSKAPPGEERPVRHPARRIGEAVLSVLWAATMTALLLLFVAVIVWVAGSVAR